MRIVYFSMKPNLNFHGNVYGVGDLVPGMAELPYNNPLAAVSFGDIAPVLFETLPADAQAAYEEGLESILSPQDEEPEEEVEEEQGEPSSITFEDFTVDDLKEVAREHGVEGFSSMKKAELIEAIEAAGVTLEDSEES